MVLSIPIVMAVLFGYCYFGFLATESFGKMSDCIYNDIDWQKIPIELKKYIILMIANMQRPLYYHGFNVVTLELNTFCRVSVLFTHCFEIFFSL